MKKVTWTLLLLLATHGICQALDSEKLFKEADGDTFDFIVVGAGTSGCVVASRLAESGRHTVLLISTGGLPHPDFDIPALSVTPKLLSDPSQVKVYRSIPQRNAALAQNGILEHKVGIMLGGGSSFNGMLLNRGSPHDFNNFANLTGDVSWNYMNLLKYFKMYENYSGSHPSEYRGFSGPIEVRRQKYAPILHEWLQGGQELGYKIAESNGEQIISFAPMDFTRSHGRRVNSYKAYIEPLLLQSSKFNNLRLLINTVVTRIMFQGIQAIGVQLISNSTHLNYIKARKEIIVTAGVIDSAVLLMKSGIGPTSLLDSAGIPAIKYLPVGTNLGDHVSATVIVVLGNKSAAFIPERDLNPGTWNMFNEIGDGPYTSYVGVSGQAFLMSSVIPPEERNLGWSDIQLLPQNTNRRGVLGGGVVVTDLKDSEVTVQWSVYVGRPKSKGSVTLDIMNIENPPMIDFQLFSHRDDMQAMIDGFKILIKLCEETAALQRIGCRVPTDKLPACSHLDFRSDSYWECYIKQLATTGLHGAGTCRMGAKTDPRTVVDSKLRVLGIQGLRVADSSIIPEITNANPMGAIYAISEKAADMILQSWENGKRK